MNNKSALILAVLVLATSFQSAHAKLLTFNKVAIMYLAALVTHTHISLTGKIPNSNPTPPVLEDEDENDCPEVRRIKHAIRLAYYYAWGDYHQPKLDIKPAHVDENGQVTKWYPKTNPSGIGHAYELCRQTFEPIGKVVGGLAGFAGLCNFLELPEAAAYFKTAAKDFNLPKTPAVKAAAA